MRWNYKGHVDGRDTNPGGAQRKGLLMSNARSLDDPARGTLLFSVRPARSIRATALLCLGDERKGGEYRLPPESLTEQRSTLSERERSHRILFTAEEIASNAKAIFYDMILITHLSEEVDSLRFPVDSLRSGEDRQPWRVDDFGRQDWSTYWG